MRQNLDFVTRSLQPYLDELQALRRGHEDMQRQHRATQDKIRDLAEQCHIAAHHVLATQFSTSAFAHDQAEIRKGIQGSIDLKMSHGLRSLHDLSKKIDLITGKIQAMEVKTSSLSA